jgi:hypothetical protein
VVEGFSSVRELSRKLKQDVPSTFNRIHEWNKWSEAESDVFRRFIFRWISFNGLYNVYHDRKGGGERDSEPKIIEDFCKDFVSGQLATEIIKSDAVRVFKENIKDRSRNMGRWLSTLDNQSMSEDEQAEAAVMVAYKIRCRLFHGQKNPNMEINEIVCEAADRVVSKVIEEFSP